MTTMATPDLFVSRSKELELLAQVETLIKPLIQEHYPDTSLLVAYLRSQGVAVFNAGNEFHVKWALKLYGHRVGFIAPGTDFYEPLTKTLLKQMPSEMHADLSQGIVVLLKNTDHFSTMVYCIHHWACYHAGLSGYDSHSRKMFSKYNQIKLEREAAFINKLKQPHLDYLQAAIRRERETIEFMQRMIHEIYVPYNNGKLIETGQANG
jgi:hypothetical protein